MIILRIINIYSRLFSTAPVPKESCARFPGKYLGLMMDTYRE